MSKNKEQEEKMAQDLLAWEVMAESQNKRKLSDKLYPSDELVTMREGNNSEFLANLSEKEKTEYQEKLNNLEKHYAEEVAKRVKSDVKKVLSMQDTKEQDAEAVKKQEAEHKQAAQNLAETLQKLATTLKTRDTDKNHITLSDLKTLEGEEFHKDILKNRSFIDKMRRKFLGIEERLSKSETNKVLTCYNTVLERYGVGPKSNNERAR